MAKDGSLRGGKRVNQRGRPRKSVIEKMENNTGHRSIKVIDDSELTKNMEEAEPVDMPPVKEFLSAKQRDGNDLCAGEIYKNTWRWLRSLKVEKLVSTTFIEQYAMSSARYIQCEEMVNKYGMIAKHPTTGAPIQSPYVAIAQSYLKHSTVIWMQIFQIVKENATVDYRGPNPNDDVMERILRARENH